MKLLLLLQSIFFLFRFIESTDDNLVLNSILKRFKITTKTKLENLFPDLTSLKTEQINNLKTLNECYNMKVGDKNFSIFNDRISPVIIHYFKTHRGLKSRLDLPSRVETFVSNLHDLAKEIIKCVHNSTSEERSLYGITSMFDIPIEKYLNDKLNYEFINTEDDSSSYVPNQLGQSSSKKCSVKQLPDDKSPIPARFNWQDQGYVTPVQNQGGCGSCYVFATIGAMESQYMINVKKENISFSEQAILNCMSTENSYGCSGGNLVDPIDQMIRVGVSLDQDAPYKNQKLQCQKYPIFMKADDICFFGKLKNDVIKRLILRNGPGAIGVNARQLTKLKGPFNGKCSSPSPTHAVLVVGWNEKYWIIKNSWSEDWGVNGYLYLPIEDCNCGFNSMLAQVIVNRRN